MAAGKAIYMFMNPAKATRLFEALSSEIRLNILGLLARHHHNGLVAGEISQQLGLASTSLSFHLKIMLNAGLVTVEQEGRYSRYRYNPAKIKAVIKFLSLEYQTVTLPQPELAMEVPQEFDLCWPRFKSAGKMHKT